MNHDLSDECAGDAPVPTTINSNTIIGYTLTQSVEVKVRDFTNIAKLLGGLPPLGINQIGGVTFTFDNPDNVLAIARADAMAKAKAKAAEMAGEAGVSLGEVVNVQEYGNIPIYPMMNAAEPDGGGRFEQGGRADHRAGNAGHYGSSDDCLRVTMMAKKDFRLILVVGAAVGLLIQPIIVNVLPQVNLGILGRVLHLRFLCRARAVRALDRVAHFAVVEGPLSVRAIRGRGNAEFFHRCRRVQSGNVLLRDGGG